MGFSPTDLKVFPLRSLGTRFGPGVLSIFAGAASSGIGPSARGRGVATGFFECLHPRTVSSLGSLRPCAHFFGEAGGTGSNGFFSASRTANITSSDDPAIRATGGGG